MWLSSSRDNWERLVAAVVKRQQIWELCHQPSRSPSISSISSDDVSQQTLSFSGRDFEPFSIPPSISQGRYRIRKPKDQDLVGIPDDVAIHLGLLRSFSLDELQIATHDFSEIIASDHVYRGWLADGSPVAVKRTQKNYRRIDQLRSEVEINNMVAHPNVIHILGFCITPDEVLLVYPLMVNGSVESRIWDRDELQSPLDWPTRKGIALGTARAVAYLHEEIRDKKVLHRDIKPSNILLDGDLEAVVGGFGMAIVAARDAPNVELDNVCGTLGYISPEYFATRRCSEKNDVYGYGEFLLALISGQKPYHQIMNLGDVKLQDWVKRKYMERKWEEIVDAEYTGNYMEDVVKLLIQIAILCTLYDPEKRPKMSQVVRMIEDGYGLAERWDRCLKG